ncbi:MAG: hypothetical protein KC583_09830, partial [Myxococcales bacterium]|nr:hypothetical protein [Myxococcales bacterium]
LAAGGILAVGVAAVVAWSFMREKPVDPRTTAAAPTTPVSAPPTVAASEDAGALDGGDPPSPLPRNSYVVIIPEPGPARFVQVTTGKVICEEARACDVPIDFDTRLEKPGHKARVLTGDDLYDRRGGRWRVKLYPGR